MKMQVSAVWEGRGYAKCRNKQMRGKEGAKTIYVCGSPLWMAPYRYNE